MLLKEFKIIPVVIFFTLLTKLIPLYILILLGFVAGKYLKVQKESIAILLIYFIVPVVIFNASFTTPITLANILFPIFCFILCFIISVSCYKAGKLLWKDGTANLFGYANAMGNVGYFGLPVAIAVLPSELIGPYLLGVLGMNIYDASGGYFLIAKGHHTAKEAFIRVLKLPILYAFLLGILFQILNIPLGKEYIEMARNFQGVFVIVGVMLIGFGIASMPSISFDIPFLLLTFATRFLMWPIIALTLIYLDNTYFHIFSQGLHQVLIVLSILPVAANSVAYSTQFNLHPHKAAMVVILSTLFALIYVPLAVTLLLK